MTQLHPAKPFGFRCVPRCVANRAASWSAVGMAPRFPGVYDHRIREQIVRTGDPDLFPELDIPRKTALSWIRRGMRDVVTVDEPGVVAYTQASVTVSALARRSVERAVVDGVVECLEVVAYDLIECSVFRTTLLVRVCVFAACGESTHAGALERATCRPWRCCGFAALSAPVTWRPSPHGGGRPASNQAVGAYRSHRSVDP